jgi:hypothetical protein
MPWDMEASSCTIAEVADRERMGGKQMQQGSIQNGRRAGARSMLVFLAFLGIALFFLLSEHRIHALGWLPLLFLLACPLLHMTMHGGHGGHAGGGSGHGGHGSSRPDQSRDPVLPPASEKF